MKKKTIIMSHPTGNANVRFVTQAVAQAGLLSGFYTCIAVFKNSFISNFLIGPLSMFLKRSFPVELKPFTHIRPFKELGRMYAIKFNKKQLLTHEKGKFCIDAVYNDLDKYVAGRLSDQNAIYAYEDGAEYSFIKAKTLGIKCIYDLPIGYWRSMHNLLQIEKDNRPDWAVTLTGFNDSNFKLARKDKELELANVIFVASTFTKKTLEVYPMQLAPVHVIPYGFPPVFENRQYTPVNNRKLKLLFVGGLSQRKGIANIFEAVDYLKDQVELTIVGNKLVENCVPLNEGLKKHTWIPSLEHDKILELMRTQDIFVFPSLFEGFGLVITEAMSQGTPVITTDRTCAPDFIKDGENGWLVEAGNTKALIQKLEAIIADVTSIEKVSKAAAATARTRPMKVYGEEMVEALNNIVNKN